MLKLFQVSRQTNLRALLVVPFVCQILVVLGAVSYISYQSGQTAIQDITKKLQRELRFRITNHLEEYLNRGNQLNHVNANAIVFNPSLLKDLPSLGRYFVHQYHGNEEIKMMALALVNGDYVETIPLADGNFQLTVLETDKSNTLSVYLLNPRGDVIRLLKREANSKFEPKSTPWYQHFLVTTSNQWNLIHKNPTTGEFVVSTSKKVFSLEGGLLAIITNQVNLMDLSLFLKDIKIGKSGTAFILDKKGFLVAESFSLKKGNQPQIMVSALETENRSLRKITEYILANNYLENQPKNALFFKLHVDNKPLLIDVIPFTNDQGIQWTIVLVIPETDFTYFLQRNLFLSISISVIAVGIAITSGLITSKFIIQPIVKLKNASQKVSEGEFDHKIPLQGIEELDSLAQHFNHMTDMLESMFMSLNQTLQEISNLKYAIDQAAIVTITDTEGRIVYCNEKLTEISGYSFSELIGQKTALFKSGYHDAKFYEDMWSTITKRKVWRGEIKNKAKDGRFYWVDTTIVPLTDEKGNINQYLSIQTEITERKELEKNLEKIVEIRTRELARANEEIRMLNQRLCSENLQLAGKLKILHQMQQLILPKPQELKKIKPLDIAGYSEPADELGGDYFDVLQLENDAYITLGIGDVTGHGLESGILMVMIQAAICTLKHTGETEPIRFLDILNRAIYYNIKRMNSEKNLSLVILNYCEGEVTIFGQHEEIIVVRKNGEIELVDTIDLGVPIGVDEQISEYINFQKVTLNPGDGIVLYTDGITEARNQHKQQYGLERLCEIVRKNWHLDCEKIRDAIVSDVKSFMGLRKIEDDLTLLLLKQR
ncbi:MAG TPA: SpoIIE family protein phosphatase [Geminocystis sp. M7585_C2015_104]|nr:SpoIIE family protein phosphatase [Geminocystis sp. M7585_C2015_104]